MKQLTGRMNVSSKAQTAKEDRASETRCSYWARRIYFDTTELRKSDKVFPVTNAATPHRKRAI
jgi:hypothetical protein